MPPAKRKANDSSSSNNNNNATNSDTKKKMTKLEKMAMKARAAWVSLNDSDGTDFDQAWSDWIAQGKDPETFHVPGQPSKSKRRKTSHVAAASKPSSASKKKAASPPTPKSAEVTKLEKELQKKRAAAWAEEEQAKIAKSAKKKSPSAATTTAKKTPPAATTTTTTPTSAASMPPPPKSASTKPSPSPSPRPNTRGRIKRYTPEEDTKKETMGAPPRHFPTTATAQPTIPPTSSPVFPQSPPDTRPSRNSEGFLFPESKVNLTVPRPSPSPEALLKPAPASVQVHAESWQDTFTFQEEQSAAPTSHAVVHVQVEVEPARSAISNRLQPSGSWMSRILLLALGFLLYHTTTFSHGKFMILGKTRLHCSTNIIGRCKLAPPDNKVVMTKEDATPINMAQQCYQDSLDHVVQMLPDSVQYSNVICPTTLPCPDHGICYGGRMWGCQAPVWVMWNGTANNAANDDPMDQPAICVLSQAVNDTYAELVKLIESWSVQYLCFNRTQSPLPAWFYTAMKNEQNPLEDFSVVTATDATRLYGFMSTSSHGIPLYPWTTIPYQNRMTLEGTEGLLVHWDWDLLQAVNDAHKQQLVLVKEEGLDDFSIGLTLHRYILVEKASLPTSCKVARGFLHSLTWMGQLVTNIFIGVFGIILYSFRIHPFPSIVITVAISLVWSWRNRNAKHKRQRKLVNEIRKMVVQKLKAAAMNNNQKVGAGMRRGEIAAIHLRDEISFEMYDDDKDRAEFKSLVWPMVCYEIYGDNRVSKSQRMVADSKRELWMWVATPAAGEEVTQT